MWTQGWRSHPVKNDLQKREEREMKKKQNRREEGKEEKVKRREKGRKKEKEKRERNEEKGERKLEYPFYTHPFPRERTCKERSGKESWNA